MCADFFYLKKCSEMFGSATHTVIWLLPRAVQHRVRLHHVIHYVTLGDLLGSELLRS